VTVFEAEPRLGGHARTIIAGKRGDQPVDTGFIVFNHVNYPNLTAMFDALDVTTAPSRMSFGASFDDGRFEYALGSLDEVFATRRAALDPRHLRMIRDIMRFNKTALARARPNQSIGDLLDELRTGAWFRERYLLPFSGAIWSTPTRKVLEFPAQAMLDFFRNHALLGYTGQHQWYTVDGGSIQYVRRLSAAMESSGVDIRLSALIAGVRRVAGGVEVRAHGAEWERFVEVILATHSDDSLAMLADPTEEETRVLGAIRYQPNRVVLHSDPAMMPRRRKVWSSWNYTEGAGKATDEIDLTYWINKLQPFLTRDQFFVTLNTTRTIRQELIWDECILRHPVYDLGALEAQGLVREMNGRNATWFCGAWMKNGFHEDGLGSALDVVAAMRADALPVAAE